MLSILPTPPQIRDCIVTATSQNRSLWLVNFKNCGLQFKLRLTAPLTIVNGYKDTFTGYTAVRLQTYNPCFQSHQVRALGIALVLVLAAPAAQARHRR